MLTPHQLIHRAKRVQEVLLITLPLDLLLAGLISPDHRISWGWFAVMICAVVSFVTVDKHLFLKLVQRVQAFQDRMIRHKRSNQLLMTLCALIVVAEVALRIGGKLGDDDGPGLATSAKLKILLIALPFLAIGFWRSSRQLREIFQRGLERRRRMEHDPQFRAMTLHRQLLAMSIAPLLCARAVSVVGALMAKTAHETALPVLGAALLLILNRPRENDVLARCRQCGVDIALIFHPTGLCSRCAGLR